MTLVNILFFPLFLYGISSTCVYLICLTAQGNLEYVSIYTSEYFLEYGTFDECLHHTRISEILEKKINFIFVYKFRFGYKTWFCHLED